MQFLRFPRATMNFPLNRLPDDSLRSVLQKVDSFKTLCRLRRSNKGLDTFVEDNRLSIRAPVGYFITCQILIHTPTQKVCFVIKDKYDFKSKHFSAARFWKIEIIIQNYCNNNLYHNSLEDISRTHFSCDALIVRKDVPSEEILEHFQTIKASEVQLSFPPATPFRVLGSPFIQSCNSASIFYGITPNLAETSSILRRVTIPLVRLFHSRVEENILLSLREDMRNRGGIQHIIFETVDDQFLRLLWNYLIWSGTIDFRSQHSNDLFKDNFNLFLMECNGGFVFITLRRAKARVYFIEGTANEDVVLEVLSILFIGTPFDMSSIWNELKNSFDITGAIERILRQFEVYFLLNPRILFDLPS